MDCSGIIQLKVTCTACALITATLMDHGWLGALLAGGRAGALKLAYLCQRNHGLVRLAGGWWLVAEADLL
jgi:hypothetical protein